MKRTLLKRHTRLSPFGRRARARVDSLRLFRALLWKRCRGRCERCRCLLRFAIYDPWNPHPPMHAHHLLPRSRGGTDEPSNGAALCPWCHLAVHEHRDDWQDWIR